MAMFLSDLRSAWRQLIRSPGLSSVAILSLALGIGANTTVFTLVNALLLNPMPVRDVARVVMIGTSEVRDGAPQFLGGTSRPNFIDLRDQQSVFSGAVLTGFTPLSLSGSGEPEQIFAQIVSGNYFDVLGPPLAAGRTFLPDEDQQLGAHPVVVLSHSLWTRRFAADPGIVGKAVTLNGQSFNVIGVTAEGFRGTFPVGGPDLWVPFAMYREVLTGLGAAGYNSRRGLIYQAFARLKDGTSIEQAQANVDRSGRALAESFPTDNRGPLVHAAVPDRSRISAGVQAAARAVGQPGHGRGRPGAPHCLRQRRQPVDGPREHAAAGDRRAVVDGRQPASADPAVPDREPAAGRRWRRGGTDRGVLVARPPLGLPPTVPAAGRHRSEFRSARAGVLNGGRGRHGTPLRSGAGLPGLAARSRHRAEGADDAGERHALVQRPAPAGGRPGGALARDPRGGRALPAQSRQRAADRSGIRRRPVDGAVDERRDAGV